LRILKFLQCWYGHWKWKKMRLLFFWISIFPGKWWLQEKAVRRRFTDSKICRWKIIFGFLFCFVCGWSLWYYRKGDQDFSQTNKTLGDWDQHLPNTELSLILTVCIKDCAVSSCPKASLPIGLRCFFFFLLVFQFNANANIGSMIGLILSFCYWSSMINTVFKSAFGYYILEFVDRYLVCLIRWVKLVASMCYIRKVEICGFSWG
jgi:hypothetical protein